MLLPDAVPAPGSSPGLRGRLPAPPLGAFPGGATRLKTERGPPLREMTSAAYGISQPSVADGVAERCQPRHLPKRRLWREVFLGKMS